MKKLMALLLLAVLVSGAQAAPLSGVTARLRVQDALFKGGQDVVVTVTITNETSERVSLLKWVLPTAVADGAMFRVTRNGLPAKYLGALYKRAAPTEADYTFLAPGQSLSQEVKLSDLFDMSASGAYTVVYRFYSRHRIAYAPGANDSEASSTAVSQLSGDRLESAPLSLNVETSATQPRRSVESERVAPDARAEATPLLTSCSTEQQEPLSRALKDATRYATTSYSYLLAHPSGGPPYVTWFGAYEATRKALVNLHFANEASAFRTETVELNCGCTESYYAYVYPSQPYTIYLCNAFWTAPPTGTDSKAGTLIHEMSHFTVVAGTDDYAYGQTAAAELALTDPAQAVMNADNHEYFAEGLQYPAPGVLSAINRLLLAEAQFGVTPSVGLGGSVVPDIRQMVDAGTAPSFTVVPNAGYVVSSTPGGTCPPGAWSGNVYTTGLIQAPCTVVFSFQKDLDFLVTATILTPTTPTAEGIFTASVTVKNQGTAAGDGGAVRVWADQSIRQACGAASTLQQSVGMLDAGSSKTLVFKDLPAGSAGGKMLRAFVDSGCRTAETDEVNNQSTLSYTVQ